MKPFCFLLGINYRKAKNKEVFIMRKVLFKKSLSIILAAGIMAASVTACGANEEATNQSDTVYETTEASDSSSSASNVSGGSAVSSSSSASSDSEASDSMSSNTSFSNKQKNSRETGDVNQGENFYGYDDSTSLDVNWPWSDDDSDNREYGHVSENDFIQTSTEPTSTFAADVDTASYSNVRNYLNSGLMVPEDAVRIEEMINYFHYDYDEPKKGEPFSVNMEVDACPWNENHQLVMIGLKAKKIDDSKRKPTNFVFLIDTSGSMNSSDKLPLVKTAYNKLLNELGEDDTVSIVTYAGSDTVVLEGESGDNTDVISEAIENLEAHGSTNGSAGINTAYELAETYFKKGGNNRVILATDGDLNVGVTSEDGLTELITEKKESGIYLSVLGFGTDNLKDNKLEALADNGNGNYAYIDSVYEAKRVLVEEMGATLETVAKDVKLQTTFDENVVEKYRLIGYENRMMANEDFDDDSVDGGEIGSGHEVTAIYEIVPAKGVDISSGKHILDFSVRYKKPNADDSKLLEYKCNYSKNGFNNQASDNMLWAESLACFGMILKGSDYSNECTFDLARQLAEKTSYKDDSLKVEYLELLDQAEDIYEGSYSQRDYDDDYDDDDYSDYDNDVTYIDAD